jgi:hypothetical protein
MAVSYLNEIDTLFHQVGKDPITPVSAISANRDGRIREALGQNLQR